MNEKDVQRHILADMTKEEQFLAIKIADRFTAGIPDYILVFEGGKTVFMETKMSPGKLSPNQAVFFDKLWKKAGVGIVATGEIFTDGTLIIRVKSNHFEDAVFSRKSTREQFKNQQGQTLLQYLKQVV